MELHTIGIDLGKTVFHLVGLNLRGEVVVRKNILVRPLPTRQRSGSMLCNRGQGDWRLTREGGWRIVISQKIELKLKFRLAINPSIGRLSRFRMI